MEITTHPSLEGLVYEDTLPLRWQALDSEPGPLDSLAINQQNRQLLQVMLATDAHVHEEDEGSESVAHDLQRIEAKLNLLLALVSKLMGQSASFPAPRPVCLTAQALQLSLVGEESGHFAQTTDTLLRLELFINSQLPTPLILVAQSRLVRMEGGRQNLIARYVGMDQETQDLWDKFLFQQHRRLIAQQRRVRNTTSAN